MSEHLENKKTCMICSSATRYFFSKTYSAAAPNPFLAPFEVSYYKCTDCGFVISRTHQEMANDLWAKLNYEWHHFFERNPTAQISNQPPYADQSLALTMLGKNGLVNLGNALDYAAGYGTMSKVLSKYFNVEISIFDKFVKNSHENETYLQEHQLKKYDLVINSAMFEHVIQRESLDEVNNLVSETGVLMMHTVVCETVPNDPNWFYITPMVHTAFHTNRSMEVLMDQWGYEKSVYSPLAKSWFLFKKNHPQIENIHKKISVINNELQAKYFISKDGFVDYWKGFDLIQSNAHVSVDASIGN